MSSPAWQLPLKGEPCRGLLLQERPNIVKCFPDNRQPLPLLENMPQMSTCNMFSSGQAPWRAAPTTDRHTSPQQSLHIDCGPFPSGIIDPGCCHRLLGVMPTCCTLAQLQYTQNSAHQPSTSSCGHNYYATLVVHRNRARKRGQNGTIHNTATSQLLPFGRSQPRKDLRKTLALEHTVPLSLCGFAPGSEYAQGQ